MVNKNKKSIRLALLLLISLNILLPSSVFANSKEIYSFKRISSLLGKFGGEQLGSEVVIGDLNKDGYKDIVASSTFYSEDKVWQGKTSIYWGPNYNLKKTTEIFGENENDQLGTAMTILDINNDNIDDLVVGAYQARYEENDEAGKVYVFYGNEDLHKKTLISAPEADIVFHGENKNERLGLSLTSGDVNGDKIDDLLISAPGAEGDQSKVYVILGGDYFPKNHRFEVKKDAKIIIYGTKNELFGSDISVGDFNGDGIGDVVIGAYNASYEDKQQNGKVYILKGRELEATRDTNNKLEYDLLRFPDMAKTFSGRQTKEWFGFNVKAMNTNEDAYDDLVVGSFMYLYKEKSGKSTIYHGSKSFFENEEDDHQIQIIGDDSENLLGASFAMGDIDGDNNPEFVLGAPGVNLNQNAATGKLFVIPEINNSGDGTFLIDREIENYFVSGFQNNDWFGSSVEVNDLDKDGLADIIVGAPYISGDNGQGLGAVYIFWGSKQIEFKNVENENDQYIKRGEAVAQIVNTLGLTEKYSDFLNKCAEEIEYCLFTFAAQSNYNQISLAEGILYPDVNKNTSHYEEIMTATKLELVQGFFTEDNSPFKPDSSLKRIHALKIILNASGDMKWKYKFELAGEEKEITKNFDDISADKDYMWWYSRYLDKAVELGYLKAGGDFRPDEEITKNELEELLTAIVNN